MARTYTQTLRIEKSYNSYLRQLNSLNERGIATTDALPYQSYKVVYNSLSSQGQPNIARTVATQYNEVTTQAEARQIFNRIKSQFGEDEDFNEDFLSVKELRGLSGQGLWQYLKDLGLSDREAGAIYDGEEQFPPKPKTPNYYEDEFYEEEFDEYEEDSILKPVKKSKIKKKNRKKKK